MKPHYIHKLIAQGEHQQLDFKFEIADSRKIAKTFSAFANTDGGKLLIGVKDNGNIAGVRSEEEFYMTEAAATMYCKPAINFESKEWVVDNKKVLEVTIKKGETKPYLAENEEGRWLAYVRVNDQNILANRVLVNAWKRMNSQEGTFINYTQNERLLLEYLENNEFITISKYRRITGTSLYKAENVLINFLSLNIIKIDISEKQVQYSLSDEFT